eukprot:CAMPEP_0170752890 /NCGR_PEP_ID=MMETSP0437-20130122/12203_1 /TAXON_ID=0 /ORGANISM="Sexangularia sp." /LENGTH=207 /DNA_ID=CAMNT_0011091977 /DNA_START=99 /DNA_END=718 /DNA_ORIENTATION=+
MNGRVIGGEAEKAGGGGDERHGETVAVKGAAMEGDRSDKVSQEPGKEEEKGERGGRDRVDDGQDCKSAQSPPPTSFMILLGGSGRMESVVPTLVSVVGAKDRQVGGDGGSADGGVEERRDTGVLAYVGSFFGGKRDVSRARQRTADSSRQRMTTSGAVSFSDEGVDDTAPEEVRDRDDEREATQEASDAGVEDLDKSRDSSSGSSSG